MSLDLYDKIKTNLNGSEKTMTKKQCTMITMLPQEHLSVVFLLILHHWCLTNKDKISHLRKIFPYNGKTITKNKRGMTFRLQHIPIDLQKILVKYLEMISN